MFSILEIHPFQLFGSATLSTWWNLVLGPGSKSDISGVVKYVCVVCILRSFYQSNMAPIRIRLPRFCEIETNFKI